MDNPRRRQWPQLSGYVTVKVLVPFKRVLDAGLRPRFKVDGSGIDLQQLKMSANPFDEIALEQGLRLKEQGIVSEIILVSVGKLACQETLRSGLAMGADRGVLIQTEEEFSPLIIAKILKNRVEAENIQLVLMGKQAIDDDANQTGQMLAAFLDWPQGTFASKIKIDNFWMEIEREVDGGHQILRMQLPAVVTVDLRLNTPRFIKMPDIMRARQKKLDIIQAESLGIELKNRMKIQKITSPPPRPAGQKVENVTQLIHKLRHEAKVIP